jgi:hypothetical protein
MESAGEAERWGSLNSWRRGKQSADISANPQCKSGGKAVLSLPVPRSRALNEGAIETVAVEFGLGWRNADTSQSSGEYERYWTIFCYNHPDSF